VRLAPLTDADTERYVQHRVTAAGGDGPTVFSQETCLEIAAASQGVPRQINTVASEALNLAAESGEAFVTPAHVQTAVSTLWGSAPSTSVKKSAAPRPATVAETPVAPAPPVAERSPVVPTAPPRASVASSAWKEDPDDSPTPIVTSHDPHEWVARFVGDRGPLQIGSRTQEPSTWDLDLLNAGHAAPRKISTPVTPVEQPTPSPAPAATAAPAAAAAPHEPAVPKPPAALVTKTIASDEPTPKAPTREESEPRTRASAPSLPAPPSAKPAVSGRMLSIAGASVAVIVAVALIIRANNQVGDRSQPASNAVVDSSKAPESHSERKAESTESSVPQLTATPPEKVLPEPPAESPAEPASKPDAEPTPPPAKLKPPYSVEVGAFDSEDIAYDQRDRFEALTGIEGWVVEPKKDGPRKYRIVLGIFSSEKRATSAANMLVKSQTLLRAKVVSLPPRHSRN
jgi:hypothetical protein